MRGLKPPPPSGLSFSAACKALMRFQSFAAVRDESLTYQSCPDTNPGIFVAEASFSATCEPPASLRTKFFRSLLRHRYSPLKGLVSWGFIRVGSASGAAAGAGSPGAFETCSPKVLKTL